MKTSDAINELATALAAAQAEMKNAPLNKTNPHFKSRYADLAGIRDTVTPALTRHGIAIVQGTDTTDSGIVVVTRLIHKSGQWMESRFPISYDKPQAMGSAYTYARRYSLSAMCAISADEDDDANAANEKAVAAPAPAAITAEQYRTLADLIEQTGTDEAKLLAFVKGESLETLNVAQFRAAETALRKKMATPKAEAA
jgi:hypothetical protein